MIANVISIVNFCFSSVGLFVNFFSVLLIVILVNKDFHFLTQIKPQYVKRL